MTGVFWIRSQCGCNKIALLIKATFSTPTNCSYQLVMRRGSNYKSINPNHLYVIKVLVTRQKRGLEAREKTDWDVCHTKQIQMFI